METILNDYNKQIDELENDIERITKERANVINKRNEIFKLFLFDLKLTFAKRDKYYYVNKITYEKIYRDGCRLSTTYYRIDYEDDSYTQESIKYIMSFNIEMINIEYFSENDYYICNHYYGIIIFPKKIYVEFIKNNTKT